MGHSKSVSRDRSGFVTRTSPGLLRVLGPALFAACLAHPVAAVGRAGIDCAAQGAFTDGLLLGVASWGTLPVGGPLDGATDLGYAGGAAWPAIGGRLPCTPSSMGAPPTASVAGLAEVDLRPAMAPDVVVRPSASPPSARVTPTALRAAGPAQPLWGVVSELRVGLLNHDVIFPNRGSVRLPNPFRQRLEGGVNVNGEVIFVAPGFLRHVGSPRPRVGGSLNDRGYTDNAYLDLDWDHRFEAGPFLEGYLGLAWHDGKLVTGNPQRLELGLRVLFHLGLEVGWRFRQHQGISFLWEHMSNSALASRNQGVDSFGLRYGYRFGL